MKKICTMQIGKNGFTQGALEILKNSFKTHGNVRICLLKSTGRNRSETEKIANNIIEELGKRYTYRIVGFTIFMKRWRRERK